MTTVHHMITGGHELAQLFNAGAPLHAVLGLVPDLPSLPWTVDYDRDSGTMTLTTDAAILDLDGSVLVPVVNAEGQLDYVRAELLVAMVGGEVRLSFPP